MPLKIVATDVDFRTCTEVNIVDGSLDVTERPLRAQDEDALVTFPMTVNDGQVVDVSIATANAQQCLRRVAQPSWQIDVHGHDVPWMGGILLLDKRFLVCTARVAPPQDLDDARRRVRFPRFPRRHDIGVVVYNVATGHEVARTYVYSCSYGFGSRLFCQRRSWAPSASSWDIWVDSYKMSLVVVDGDAVRLQGRARMQMRRIKPNMHIIAGSSTTHMHVCAERELKTRFLTVHELRPGVVLTEHTPERRRGPWVAHDMLQFWSCDRVLDAEHEPQYRNFQLLASIRRRAQDSLFSHYAATTVDVKHRALAPVVQLLSAHLRSRHVIGLVLEYC
jgi:hypothetical protein